MNLLFVLQLLFLVHVTAFMCWRRSFFQLKLVSSAFLMNKMLLLFSDFSSDLSLFSASQQDFQATIDQRSFDYLIATFSIQDQACLMVLSDPSGISSS